MNEIKRLSYSMIRTYLECPRSFYFRYVKELPSVLDGRLIAGRVYHHGVSYALKRKMAGEMAFLEEVSDIMADSWEAQLSEQVVYDELDEPKVEAKEIDWQDDSPGRLKDITIRLAGIYLSKVLPKLEPVAVEERLEGEINGISLVGYPDCVLNHNGVIDHKFAKRRMPQEDADKDQQLSIYAILLKKPIWGGFHQALDQKNPDIHVVLTERNQNDMEWTGKLIEQVWEGIQSGVFPPNPLTWKCGDRCSYQIECRILCEY
jgi:CRISPR/Cas system-associated exonuclease Cas4 (RecB family)